MKMERTDTNATTPRLEVQVEITSEKPTEEEIREKQKREERDDLINDIALLLVVSGFAAGAYCWEMWCSPNEASGFDVFLFFYALIGVPLGFVMMAAVNFCNKSGSGSSLWWFYNVVP